jgi:hypothetical protein
MIAQVIPLGALIVALIHPRKPWVRSAVTASGVRIYHWPLD